ARARRVVERDRPVEDVAEVALAEALGRAAAPRVAPLSDDEVVDAGPARLAAVARRDVGLLRGRRDSDEARDRRAIAVVVVERPAVGLHDLGKEGEPRGEDGAPRGGDVLELPRHEDAVHHHARRGVDRVAEAPRLLYELGRSGELEVDAGA